MQETVKAMQTLSHTIMGLKYTFHKVSGEFVATLDPSLWGTAYPWLPLALQNLGGGKGLVLHRTGLVYYQIRLPENVFSALSASDLRCSTSTIAMFSLPLLLFLIMQ